MQCYICSSFEENVPFFFSDNPPSYIDVSSYIGDIDEVDELVL